MAEDILSKLQAAVKGLTYQSESDKPFTVVHWKDTSEDFDFKKVPGVSHKAAKTLKSVPLEEFFRDLIKEQSWHGPDERKQVKQYRALMQLCETQLVNPKVFRAGEVQVNIFIVGKTGTEDWYAVKTKAVET